jgi:DNA invertase Pin-like site-specific DNA recombinase
MGNNGCPLPVGSPVWGYIRDSGGEDQDIVSQKAAILDCIERHGLVLDRLFVDEARPGSSVIGRDAFEDMIHVSRQEPRPVDGIVLWSFSRFSRNLLDAQFFKADLRRRGYKIISMTDDLPGGDLDVIVEALYDWKHEQYLKDLSRNVKRTLHQLTRQGFSVGGFPPRGYKVEKVQIGVKRNGEPRYASKGVADPRCAPAVQEAFRMRAEGATAQEILDKTGLFKSRQGLSWFFRNKTYLGVRKCGEIEVEAAHEPLIDRETWNRVQATLRSRPERGGSWPCGHLAARRVRSPYLLSGLTRCARCGSAMIGSFDRLPSGTRWRFYVCGKRKREGRRACPTGKLKASLVEGEVMRRVMNRILTPAYSSDLLDAADGKLNEEAASLDGKVARMRRRLSEVNRAIYNLLDLAEQQGSTAARDRLADREREKARLEGELQSLLKRKARTNLDVSEEVMTGALSKMREELGAGDVQTKRGVLKRFVDRIEAERERARLWYTFPLLGQRVFYSMPPAERKTLKRKQRIPRNT